MLLANGDLAFKGCSANCSLGLNFWSENLLSAGDITGEASLSPLLLSICVDQAASSPPSKEKVGKTQNKRPIFWLQTKHVAGGGLGDLAEVTSSLWGFGGTLHGALQPWLLFLWHWTPARPPRRRDLRAPVTHFGHGSACDKAFPAQSVMLTPSPVGDSARWVGAKAL